MSRQNNRRVGSAYEEKAAQWLEERGFLILEHNYRCRLGEIDLIARREDILAFVEVKFRLNHAFGYSQEAVDRRKRQRIFRVAQYYVAFHPWAENMNCRFDVAAFGEDGSFSYLEGAFGGM